MNLNVGSSFKLILIVFIAFGVLLSNYPEVVLEKRKLQEENQALKLEVQRIKLQLHQAQKEKEEIEAELKIVQDELNNFHLGEESESSLADKTGNQNNSSAHFCISESKIENMSDIFRLLTFEWRIAISLLFGLAMTLLIIWTAFFQSRG